MPGGHVTRDGEISFGLKTLALKLAEKTQSLERGSASKIKKGFCAGKPRRLTARRAYFVRCRANSASATPGVARATEAFE